MSYETNDLVAYYGTRLNLITHSPFPFSFPFQKYLKTFTDENVRPDGRPMHRVRETTIVQGVLTRNTYGSALVRIGDTRVVAGVTLLVGRPAAAYPNHGEMEVSVTVGPLCSPQFGPSGRPVLVDGGGGVGRNIPTDASTVESFVQRTLLRSGIVDLSDLCIQEGKCAWKLRVSIVCLNHDGNIEDAALLSAVTALSDTKLPATVISSDGIVSIANDSENDEDGKNLLSSRPLKLRYVPVPLTIGMFDGKLLVDPSSEEETVLDGLLTVVMTATGQVVTVNKPGGECISPEDLAACMTLATGRAKEIESAIYYKDT